jgi:very-short-patch-repair endonuclease
LHKVTPTRRGLAIEIDGLAHDQQEKYDAGRDRWLLEKYAVKTIRISNDEVLKRQALLLHHFFT